MEELCFYFSLSVCACVCVCVCLSVCEQHADQTATPILTRSSLNSCLLQSLEPYWNWWPWVKDRSQWRNIHFSFIILCYLPYFGFQPSYDRSKWNSVCRLDMPLVDVCLNFIRFELVMTSFKFSAYNCPYFQFLWTCKLYTWYRCTTT